MKKRNQNYANHRRFVAGYHIVLYTFLMLILIAGVVVSIKAPKPMLGAFILLNGVSLVLITFFARYFALRAQDRAIRTEENFRHYIMTGKPLSSGLRMSQIIALRFAGDDEYLALVERAEKEKLSGNEIKKAIKNWKGDYYRV
ncbi:MAG: hypothetical protein IPM74_01405 [Crocinitomicaceae bacterium]|nr:hypothetical protein [Crocinitomicaceae bacterium]MBK8924573.1 hypothetical protein [Crocinitomicaceae bacterium]